MRCGFPQNMHQGTFWPKCIFEANFRVFSSKQHFRWQKPEAAPTQTLCSSSTAQDPRSNCNAQPSYGKPLGVSRTRSNQPTCTTPPATLAVVRGIPLSWSGMPLRTTRYYLKRSPRLFTRIEHTQHTIHHKTTQQNTQTTSTPSQPNYSTTSRWRAPTRFLLSRRALRSESWGSDIVRRTLAPALLSSRPEALIFRWHIFFVWFVPDVASAWPELLQCTTLLPLARRPTFRGWKNEPGREPVLLCCCTDCQAESHRRQ